jgi:hypothetical protein
MGARNEQNRLIVTADHKLVLVMPAGASTTWRSV